MIPIIAMLKDEGCKNVQIPPSFLPQLAKSISVNGFEWLTLKSGPIAVTGFVVIGKQTGDRVIVLGKGDAQPKESV